MKKLVLGLLILAMGTAWPAAAQEGGALSPEVLAQLKKGKRLDLVWADRKFNPASGFLLGRISSQSTDYYANTLDYLPYALGRLVLPGSTNRLDLVVTDLHVEPRYTAGIYVAHFAVEGTISDRDGNVVFAFTDGERASDRETADKNCEAVMDSLVFKLGKELGKPFLDAMAAKRSIENGGNANPSGLVPPQPKGPQPTLSVGERLLQLDNLHKNGLLTDEEYAQKKAEIMKGL